MKKNRFFSFFTVFCIIGFSAILFVPFAFVLASVDSSYVEPPLSGEEYPLVTQPAVPSNPSASAGSMWEVVSTSTQDKNYRNMNWQERKILHNKMNELSFAMSDVVSASKDAISRFNKKKEEIALVSQSFTDELMSLLQGFDPSYQTVAASSSVISIFENDLLALKETIFFTLNKEFREAIEKKENDCRNVRLMIDHYERNISSFYQLKSILDSSFSNLDFLGGEIARYDNSFWEKYQKIEDFISDTEAKDCYDEAYNYFDNMRNIDQYMRRDFLSFFNQGISNLNTSQEVILDGVELFIALLKKLQYDIDLLKKQNEDYLNAKKIEEEEKVRSEKERAEKEEKRKKELKKKRQENRVPFYTVFFQKSLAALEEVAGFFASSYTFLEKFILSQYRFFFGIATKETLKKRKDKRVQVVSHVALSQNDSVSPLFQGTSQSVVTSDTQPPTVASLGSSQGGNNVTVPVLPEVPVLPTQVPVVSSPSLVTLSEGSQPVVNNALQGLEAGNQPAVATSSEGSMLSQGQPINDVFSQEQNPHLEAALPLQEKEKDNQSLYETLPPSEPAMVQNESLESDHGSLNEMTLPSTEVITTPPEEVGPHEESQESHSSEPFHYQEAELSQKNMHNQGDELYSLPQIDSDASNGGQPEIRREFTHHERTPLEVQAEGKKTRQRTVQPKPKKKKTKQKDAGDDQAAGPMY